MYIFSPLYLWMCMVVTQANLWCGPVLQRQMLCHMSSLLDSMKGARQIPLHPATTYGVQRVPHRAGEAVVRPTQPSPPYGHLRPVSWIHPDRDVKYVDAIAYIGPGGWCKAENKVKWKWEKQLSAVIMQLQQNSPVIQEWACMTEKSGIQGMVMDKIFYCQISLLNDMLRPLYVLQMINGGQREVVSPDLSAVHLSERHNTGPEHGFLFSLSISVSLMWFWAF